MKNIDKINKRIYEKAEERWLEGYKVYELKGKCKMQMIEKSKLRDSTFQL